MKNFQKLCAQIILQCNCCCNNQIQQNGLYNLLLTKLLPSQLNKIKYLKELEDSEEPNDTNICQSVDFLEEEDPILYIILTDDLIDLNNRNLYLQNIENSEQYPDDLKYLALECFNHHNSISEQDCGECRLC